MKKRKLKSTKKVAVFLLLMAVWMASSFVWLQSYFADLTMDKLIFQMRVPMTGTNSDIIWNYLLYAVPPCLVMGLLLWLLLRKPERIFKFRIFTLLRKGLLPLSILCVLVSAGYGIWRFDIPDYLYAQTHASKLYENHYVDPNTVELTFPEKKRNLIYIFLESFEQTFASAEYGGFQEENLIPNLTKLQQEKGSTYFSEPGGYGMTEMANCSWTMASMVAQTSGIPLSIPLAHNDYDMYDTFLPGVTTLTDSGKGRLSAGASHRFRGGFCGNRPLF